MINKENKIDFESPDGSVIANEEFSGPIVASEWKVIEGVKGVRYKEWKYADISNEIVDGALVEIIPGHRTPVQYVETDHVFDENFQQGKFLLFHITDEGLAVYKYDSSIEEISFSLQVHQGELMCLYVLKENEKPGAIIECEQPGFSLAKLVTVPEGTAKMGDLEIPEEFWNAIKMLDQGVEDELPIEIIDMEDEMMEPVDKVKKITEKAIHNVRSLLYGAPDELIKAISSILPETPIGEFLNSYEEAQKIAKELMSGRESVGRKELDEMVIKIIRERANANEVALVGLEKSLDEGTLSDDFPSCYDFIDFVALAIEEDGGKVIEKEITLLDEANSILLKICGSGFSIESLPEPLAGTEELRDKKIIMVDDQEIYFSAFVPSLLAETEGKAKFVIHKDQTLTELVNTIIESESDVVLLDLNLANGIKGTEVANVLKEKGFSGKVIGFSSDMRAVDAFKKVGAEGVVMKDINGQESAIRGMVEILKKSLL